MTVNTTNITSGPYVGNGAADTYDYLFRVTNKNQLSVYETDDSGVQTLLTVDTDYTVAGIGDDAGGLVTRVAGNLPTDYVWYIRSNYIENQLTAFASQGGFFPDVHENQMDHLTFLIQQIIDKDRRAFRLSETIDIDGSFTIPNDAAGRAGLFLAFNASGDLTISSGTGADVGLRTDLASTTNASLGSALIGIFRSVSGYVGRTLSAWISSRPYYISDFGTTEDGVTLDTTKIQTALDLTPAILEFPVGGIIALADVEIKGPIHIKGNGCILKPSAHGIFKVGQNISGTVIIEGFIVDWGSPSGTVGKEFFYNISDGGINSTSFPTGTPYDIDDLIIRHNKLSHSKIVAYGAGTNIKIEDNIIEHDNTVTTAPAYILCSRGAQDSDSGPVYIIRNRMDIYAPTGSNNDVIKITGGISAPIVEDNNIINRNLSSMAQLDLFTGGHKSRVTRNNFVNIQTIFKQTQGSGPSMPLLQHYNSFTDNIVQIDDGSVIITGLQFTNTRGIISGNHFVLKNTTVAVKAIHLEISDSDMLFSSQEASADIITGNIFDLTGTFTGSQAVLRAVGATSPGKGLLFANNIQLGGSTLVGSGVEYSAINGNIWLDSSGASGTSINTGDNSIAIGNVADTFAPLLVSTSNANKVSQELRLISSADTTPSVARGDMLKITNGSIITDFDDGYIGQTITIFGAPCTIQAGTNISLNGSVNFVFASLYDSLTLRKVTSTKWAEVGRSVL